MLTESSNPFPPVEIIEGETRITLTFEPREEKSFTYRIEISQIGARVSQMIEEDVLRRLLQVLGEKPVVTFLKEKNGVIIITFIPYEVPSRAQKVALLAEILAKTKFEPTSTSLRAAS